MSMTKLKAIVILTLLTSFTAYAGNEGAHGGDELGLQFQEAFLTAVQVCSEKLPDVALQIKKSNLIQLISHASILTVNQNLPVMKNGIQQDSVATNNPETLQILINRYRWSEIANRRIREALALHEVASLAGLEDTGQYSLSAQYLALFSLDDYAHSALLPDCGRKEAAAMTRAQDQFSVGEIVRAELMDIQLSLIRARMSCGTVTKANFCFTAMPIVLALAYFESFENKNLQTPSSGRKNMSEEIEAMSKFCQ